MGETKNGLGTAVELAANGQAGDDAAEMLGNEDWGGAPMLPLGDSPVAAAKAAGRGRPAGSMNRKTKDLAQYLGALGYRDPALILAETYSRPAGELAKALKCKTAEAYKLQLDAANALMPYLHGKRPTQIELDSKGLPMIQINLGQPSGQGADRGDSMSILDAFHISADENQETE